MKLTQQQVKDFCTMIEHSRADISYREGGSFTCENKDGEWVFDTKAAEQVERAINTLKKIILTI